MSHAELADDLRGLLTTWPSPTAAQEALRVEYLTHLDAHDAATDRSGPPAHFTASCLVVDPGAEHVLLTLHPKVGRWLQFGGHLEDHDRSVAAGALREALEESGLSAATLQLRPGLVQLDRHSLGSGFTRCTEHLDLRWIAVAAHGAEPVASEESDDLAWWSVDALPEDMDDSLRSLVELAGRV
ncbi:NUDIX hydrolase [Janibacter alittae]|uniref:NUDIX domain-containing protein n=1 Tax=Janibacter alittae TaxID=3115209 RepID=A0ABZ2MJD8_9MICO